MLAGGSAIFNAGAVNLSTSVADLTLSAAATIGSLPGVAGSTVTLGANTLSTGDASNTSYAGVIGSTGGGLTKQGSGAFTLAGVNSYTGATTVSAGSLVLTGGNAIANTSAVNLSASGANLTLSATETIGSLTGVAGSAVTLGANTLTTGDASNSRFTGVLLGSGGLIKQGRGNFTLGGLNAFVGDTTVTGGTLTLGAGGSLSSATVNVAGGTLATTGNEQMVNTAALSVAAGATLTIRCWPMARWPSSAA